MRNKEYKKVTICLGLNDKDTKIQKIATSRAAAILSDILCRRFAGATVINAAGVYTHDAGEQVQEASFVIILYFVNELQVKEFASLLCRTFNQESVTIEKVRRGWFGDHLTVEFFSL